MKAVHGNVADIKKIRSRAVVSIHIEIPVESYAAAVAMLDEKDVLITIAPEGVGAYGLIVSKEEPAIEDPLPISYQDDHPKKIDHSQSRLAAMYCKNKNFKEFLAVTRLDCDPFEVNENFARNEILAACGIDSRAELDTNQVAQTKFIVNFCKPYTDYMQSREDKL